MITTDSDTLVNGRSTFNGNSATEATSTVKARSSSGRFDSDSTTRSYYDLVSGPQVKVFGTITQATASGFSITTTVRLEPFLLRRFDLSSGNNFTQSYTIKTETNPSFSTIPDQSATAKITFVGMERISVPAGSFNSCKFTTETTIGGSTTTSTEWFATGNGTSLRTLSGNTDSVLVSATINGTQVAGN